MLAACGLLVEIEPADPGRVEQALLDLAHLPLFFLLAYALQRVLTGRFAGNPAPFGKLCGGLFLFAGLMEGIQQFAGREAALHDWLLGGAGLALAWLLQVMRLPLTGWRRGGVALLWVLLSGAAVWRPFRLMEDNLWARLAYPVIASFESGKELARWDAQGCTLQLSTNHVVHGRFSARIGFAGGAEAWPGAFTRYFRPYWTGAKTIEAHVFWPGNAGRELHFRVDDKPGFPPHDDRFQTSFLLIPGSNVLTIATDLLITPSGRELELKTIERLGFFLAQAEEGESLYIDSLRIVEQMK